MTTAGGLHLIASGTFVGSNAVKTITLPGNQTPDLFEVYNISDFGSAAANTATQYARWIRGLADGAGYVGSKTSGSATIAITSMQTSDCFRLENTSNQTPEAKKTGTDLTKAAPARCTVTSHGYLTGDIVRIFDGDEMDQIDGLEFTITTVDANTFDLTNMDTNTANFTANTSFSCRRIPFNPIYYPRYRVITDISQATSAIVTMAVTHGLTVGQLVKFVVPSDFGMTELDGLRGEITAIGASDANSFTNTITVNVDTSAFTAFAWPAATAFPLTHAQVIPFGDDATVLDGATENQATIQMKIGTTVLDSSSSGDTFRYFAYKFVDLN